MRSYQNILLSTATVFATVATPTLAFAQLVPGTPYQRTRAPNTFVPLSSPTILWSDVDDDTLDVNLPFPVKFYQTMQTGVSVEANGAIAFPTGITVTRFNTAPGTTGTPSGFVGAMWDDLLLTPGVDKHIGYQVEGTAPTRTITFEWRNLGFYELGNVIGNMSFQIRLYEGASGRIDIDYGPKTGTFVGSATMGMEDTMNGAPILFPVSGCTAACTFADFPANTRVSVVQDPGVELVAVDVRPPEFAFLGAQVLMPVIVQNLHGAPIGPFTVSVVAAATADLANSVEIGTTTLSLPAFATGSLDILTVPPTSLGTNPVYVGVVVDSTNLITEVEEANNTAVSARRMRLLVGSADLAVQRVRSSASSVNAGDTLDVFTRVQNVGGNPVQNLEVAVILSTNPVISVQDVKLASYTVSLAPGETVNATTTVTIDAATNSGTYYVGALADPMGTVDELSESNNGLADVNPIVVTGGALTIVSTALPEATVGQTYTASLVAAGGDSSSGQWTITQGMLPTGIGISPPSGELFGRPMVAETQTFTVQVASGGEVATKMLSLTVVDPNVPLTIVTRDVMPAVVGQEYVFAIVATGGDGVSERTWSAANLPAGIQMTDQGVLVGTADTVDVSTIDVTVMQGAESASRSFELDVQPNANLLIVPRVLSTAHFEQPYSEQLMASGGIGQIAWLLEVGRLPAGLSLSTSGEISGTPTQVGRFRFVVEARDTAAGLLATDQNTFEIDVIDGGDFMISTDSLPDGVVGQGYDATIVAMNGLPPLTWRIKDGRLPEGLVSSTDDVTSAFRIAGQANSEGISNILIDVTDSQGRVATRAFALRVAIPIAMEPVVEPGCTCATRSRGTGWAGGLLFSLIGMMFVARSRRRIEH